MQEGIVLTDLSLACIDVYWMTVCVYNMKAEKNLNVYSFPQVTAQTGFAAMMSRSHSHNILISVKMSNQSCLSTAGLLAGDDFVDSPC